MSQYDGLALGPAATRERWAKVHRDFYDSITGKSDCVFQGSARRTQQLYAQRMLTMRCGPRPEGHLVRHHCENDSCAEQTCCNPLHLSWGTPKQNTADAVEAGHMTFQRPSHPMYIKVACPHCGKVGASMIMSRWHFGNCRSLRNA